MEKEMIKRIKESIKDFKEEVGAEPEDFMFFLNGGESMSVGRNTGVIDSLEMVFNYLKDVVNKFEEAGGEIGKKIILSMIDEAMDKIKKDDE